MNDALQKEIDVVLTTLLKIAGDFSPAVFASSLGAEDMVLTDLIYRHNLPIDIFTLDTGRLHEETHALLDAIAKHYHRRPQVHFPHAAEVADFVSRHGSNAFYASVELRKACCHVRKVAPLRRVLAGRRAWVTGLRREQGVTRGAVHVETFDTDNGLMKFSPLALWSEKRVWEYIHANHVPYNVLHDRHYPSIGCAPCTRAIAVGEDVRAGRWWWEDAGHRECGLHPQAGKGTVGDDALGLVVLS